MRAVMKAILLTLLSVWLSFGQEDSAQAAGIQKDGQPVSGPAFVDAGKRLFQNACSACHGLNGGGGHGPSLTKGDRIRALNDVELFNSIQKGVPGTDMPAAKMPELQVRQLVAFVRSLSAPAIDSAAAGNAEAGNALFFGKAGCASCHMIHAQGGVLGPDLSDAGVRMTLNQLQESLLQPDKQIAEGYQGIAVVTLGGEQIQGIAKNQDNYSIQILDTKGRLHLLAKTELRSVEVSARSLMPNDFGSRLTPAEIQNLISFLSRQSVRERKTP